MSNETRKRVPRIGRDEFGGASADETVRRLIDEHRRTTAVATVHRNHDADPEGWSNYLAEADELTVAYAPVDDE